MTVSARIPRPSIFLNIALLLWLLAASAWAAPAVTTPAENSGEESASIVSKLDGQLAKRGAEGFKTGITTASARLGRWIDRSAETRGPTWLAGPWIAGISGARILASLAILALAVFLTVTVGRSIRKNAGHIHSDAITTKPWPKILLTAARKPLALVLWVYALYFAGSLLIDATAPSASIAWLGRKLTSLTYIGAIIAVFWLTFRIIAAVQKILLAKADRPDVALNAMFVPVIGTALRSLVVIAGILILAGTLDLPPPIDMISSKAVAVLVIVSIASLIIRSASTAEKVLLKANRLDVADNLRARQIYTQVSVIRKIIVICVSVLSVGCVLMLFQPVRQFGTSILASAGIAGIVLGLAAQKTLSNLIAGIQIAISQPIRIDDVVIVEGEWGWIEEIALTFVTVRVWDLRRLVLPINYFLEKPFQNWTRTSAKLINSFFLHVDYTLPVEPLRQELTRLLEANPLWDGDVNCLQVTDSTPKSMEIRCLMSSEDAPKGWDLKCAIREGLVNFLRQNHPECLPKVRAEVLHDPVLTDRFTPSP